MTDDRPKHIPDIVRKNDAHIFSAHLRAESLSFSFNQYTCVPVIIIYLLIDHKAQLQITYCDSTEAYFFFKTLNV
jgi:hypothetical protein